MQTTTTDDRYNEPKRKDPRFTQLMEQAKNGQEEGIHSLWSEFGYDYHTGKFSADSQGVDGDDWIEPEDEGSQV